MIVLWIVLAAILVLVGTVLGLNAAGSAVRRRYSLAPRGLPFVVAAAGSVLAFALAVLIVVLAIV